MEDETMSLLASLPFLGGLVEKISDRVLSEKRHSADQQSAMNHAEISGAPQSWLRLWRSFLGWVLALSFAWEVMVRPVLATYWPELTLPPSVLEEISRVLMGMLGLEY